MRIGAIFARGSCRALRWMVVLGALSVLGSAQATAQDAPTPEEAKYDSATSRSVRVTMSSEVWVNLVGIGENAQNLSDDFALVGGNTGVTAIDGTPEPARAPGELMPIAVDGIPSDRYPGTRTFTLRFDRAVADLTKATALVPRPTRLRLVYAPDAARPIVGTVPNGDTDLPVEAIVAGAGNVGFPVIGPEQTSDLQLDFEPGELTALQEPMKRGAVLVEDPDNDPPVTPYQLPLITLPKATGPVGTTLTYSVINLPPTLMSTTTAALSVTDAAALGLTATQTGPNARATIYGPLPSYIGTWDVIYMVEEEGDDGDIKQLRFKINVADTPEAVTELEVFPAGPSSLKVTWDAPVTNNDPVTSYDLEYRVDGATNPDYA